MKKKMINLMIIITSICVLAGGCTPSGQKKSNADQETITPGFILVPDVEGSALPQERVDDQTMSDEVLSDNTDLLYKESQMGKYFLGGGHAVITVDKLNALITDPKSIDVYYNGKIIKSIAYNNTDIEISTPTEGMYCFLVINKDNEIYNITEQVEWQTVGPVGSSRVPLIWK